MFTRRIDSPQEAARILLDGGLVAFPTETVFGLGVDATNPSAVEKLYNAKGRPNDNPLIVHLADPAEWRKAAAEMTISAERLLEKFAPGPITVVLPKNPNIDRRVSAGLNTIGIRIPQHPVARQILRDSGLPVAAPSANRSGRPSGTTWQSVLEDLDGRIDAVFCQDSSSIGIESTVVDCTGQHPIVLRPGAITLEQIRSFIPTASQLSNSPQSSDEMRQPGSLTSRSPGLLHPHYQPRAKVIMANLTEIGNRTIAQPSAYCGVLPPSEDQLGNFSWFQLYETVEDYAANFYEFLREADRRQIRTVVIQPAAPVGIGQALLDRQRRAASSD